MVCLWRTNVDGAATTGALVRAQLLVHYMVWRCLVCFASAKTGLCFLLCCFVLFGY